jgi:hypothetical protein
MAEHRVERRLAAILAADVAGYSRLMGLDEEGTLARLKAHLRDLVDPRYVRSPLKFRHDLAVLRTSKWAKIRHPISLSVDVDQRPRA